MHGSVGILGQGSCLQHLLTSLQMHFSASRVIVREQSFFKINVVPEANFRSQPKNLHSDSISAHLAPNLAVARTRPVIVALEVLPPFSDQ